MKNTIDLLQQHVSVRDFKTDPLSSDIKEQLLIAARSGSSSNFVQATSIIEITDFDIRERLATISKSDAYVKNTGTFYMFIADLHRHANLLKQAEMPLTSVANTEALIVSIVDTTIAAENMAIAAESLGLGICFIGGIRNDLFAVRDLLHLPDYTVPLFGLTIGIPNVKNEIKPRLPQKNTVFENYYDEQAATDLSGYDLQMARYYTDRTTHQQSTNWTDKMLEFFKEPRRPDVADFIKEQGFSL